MKVLTPSTLAPMKGRNTVSRISISKTGMFTISTGAVETMGLAPGDRIQFIEMGEKPGDDVFAVPIGKSGDGFEIRKHKRNDFYLFSSSELRRQVLQHFYPDKELKKTVTLLIGGENKLHLEEPGKTKKAPVRAWPLLAKTIV